jgi:ribosomal-protein-serine acetyltransferase
MLVIPPRPEIRARPIETERLFLHPVDPSDGAELWFAVNGSRASLQRWLPWVVFHTDQQSSIRFAEACAADWDQGRAVRFTIRERATRTLIGIVGLEMCVHLHRSSELGYWLRKDATGRGLMTEAARATVDFAFKAMGAHRVRVAAATDNHASLNVIRRLGFRFEGFAREAEWCDGRWLDHAVFALLEQDSRA